MANNDDSKEEETTTNPYLALREAKIARNQARLRELGLESSSKKKEQIPNPKKPAKTASTPYNKVEEEPTVLRRSRRLSQEPETSKLEEETNVDTFIERRPKRPRPSKKSDNAGKKTQSSSRPPPAANSVRAISIDPENLVLGKERVGGVLGIPMEETGKEFVIYESFERVASEPDRQRLEGSRLSFNKYCGVQEWNNAIFLWVNLGGKDGTVVNEFLDGGSQITWFGGSRMQDDTPVVQRLLTLGRQASSSSSGIILWCRRYEKEKKTFSPYVCLGRLAYHSHVPGSYPLSFVWTLLDHSALQNHSDEAVRQGFQQFVDTTIR
jgi:hypothetical protein